MPWLSSLYINHICLGHSVRFNDSKLQQLQLLKKNTHIISTKKTIKPIPVSEEVQARSSAYNDRSTRRCPYSTGFYCCSCWSWARRRDSANQAGFCGSVARTRQADWAEPAARRSVLRRCRTRATGAACSGAGRRCCPSVTSGGGTGGAGNEMGIQPCLKNVYVWI